MDRKFEISRLYDRYAIDFDKEMGDYLIEHILNDAELFLSNLSGKRILDLGSGPGRHSKYFLERGLEPVCVDISSNMLNLCKTRGLDVCKMDIENLGFKNNSFDGVWAYTSLLHSPKKHFIEIISSIFNILKDKGIFYIGMREGNFEGWLREDGRYGSEKRFMSLYNNEELRDMLSMKFEILYSSMVKARNVYLNYLCEKKIVN